MTFRQRLAVSCAPVVLRAILGLVFLWAGLAKLAEHFDAAPADAALLATMGAIEPPGPAPRNGSGETPAQPDSADPAQGVPPPQASLQSTPKRTQYVAEDFPAGARVRNVMGIALMLYKAAHPGNKDDGTPKMAYWPPSLAGGSWPVVLAWAVALTETFAGLFVLLGLFTRLSALAISGVMLGAIWLAVIGPAMQSGETRLGFLPKHPPFDPKWVDLLWPLTLLAIAKALFLAGPGTLSLDRAVFRRSDDADDEGDDED